jgi:hypothetical protein
VVSVILQHVQERSPYLERRAKRPGMVPVAKERTSAAHACVQATGQTHRESLHRARKRASVSGLDEEMDMVRLNRELHEACSEPVSCCPERGKDEPRQCSMPETRKASPKLHRDVHRMPLFEFGAAHVRYAGLRTGWLPS